MRMDSDPADFVNRLPRLPPRPAPASQLPRPVASEQSPDRHPMQPARGLILP
jgi:hypothetical protein